MQVKADAFYEGVGYYRKKQFFGNELAGKRVFLRFEGVGLVQKSMSTESWWERIKAGIVPSLSR